MILPHDFMTGSWKGELVYTEPADGLYDESIEFLLKLNFDWGARTCSGIYITNPEKSGIEEHAKVYGEIKSDQKIKLILKYPKFYFKTKIGKEVKSDETRVHPDITLTGSLNEQKRLFGNWHMPEDFIEWNDSVLKTGESSGIWWAEKL